MVLASIINERKRQEGIKQGIEQGIELGKEQERKRWNAKLRAVAEKYGIPEDELLPIGPEDDGDDA